MSNKTKPSADRWRAFASFWAEMAPVTREAWAILSDRDAERPRLTVPVLIEALAILAADHKGLGLYIDGRRAAELLADINDHYAGERGFRLLRQAIGPAPAGTPIDEAIAAAWSAVREADNM